MPERSPFIFVEREAVRDLDTNSRIVRLTDGRELPLRLVRMIPAVMRGGSVNTLAPIDAVRVARVAKEMDGYSADSPFDDRPA